MCTNEIINAIEDLAKEPGFIYSLAIILQRDQFLDPEEVADINWHERLIFQELSFLVGLMVKNKIDYSVIPTENTLTNQINRTYELFQKLHENHLAIFADKLSKKYKQSVEDQNAEDNYKDFMGNGELMAEPIFYGDSGAYDFQYLEFAQKKYKNDETWIYKNKGITLSIVSNIYATLKKLSEERWQNFQIPEKFEELCKSSLSVFCFNQKDLEYFDVDAVKNFIKAFSVIPGTVNQNLNSVGMYNAIDSHPIVTLAENLYFLPVGFNFSRSIYESPFYWMSDDDLYRDTAFNNRGESAENIVYEILEDIFGKENVYKEVKVCRNRQDLTDIDVLAIAGNKAVIVQAKSKKLTELSKKGDEARLRADFKEAVQKAYNQGLICRSAIIDKKNDLVTEDGKKLYLSEFIDDAYIICITLDHYPAITHQSDIYLEKQPQDPYPLAMSIFDLDIIAFYLKDPFDFLYYIRQRVALSSYYEANSELVLLGSHLRQKLFPNPDVDREALDDGFAQLIDANFPAMRGYQPKTSAVEKLHHQWKNEKFEKLINQIKAIKQPGLTDALFFLYDLAGKGADDLISWIEKTIDKTIQDGRMHSLSMGFENGKSGVSFICLPNFSEKIKTQLVSFALAKKYKTKADMWLGLCSIAGSSNIVDAVTFNNQPWVEDSNLEEISKIALKAGVRADLDIKKIGRNDPCICGSGKKFKKCCGR
ncbi:MAG: SEC-C metal-binding domain-containing protein [Candidatus Pacebacteria bacterium]|nr:SEC-C metal-binding domain-containing protein [Candidatus Paceibacterota bacterium]